MNRTHNPTVSAADLDEFTLVTAADTLRGAARYLELHGWVQHIYYGPEPGYVSGRPARPFPPACADGALGLAAYGRKAGFPGETRDPGYRDYNRARAYFNGYLRQIGYRPPCDSWCEGGTDCRCDNDDAEVVFTFNDADQRVAEDVTRALRAAAHDYDRTHAVDQTPDITEPLLDTGGYLACGCHGSQRDHTCGPLD